MARTNKSKLNGLSDAVSNVRTMSDNGHLDFDLALTVPFDVANAGVGMKYESLAALEEDIKLVLGTIENGEF